MAMRMRRSGLLAGAAGLAMTGIAHAQAAGEAAVAPEPAAALEEVVVTAQKRSENLQKVPIAVSAMTSAEIDRQKINSVNAIAAQIPNLYISTPYSDAVPVFSLRGVSAVDYSQNQSSPVALYVDEVYKGLGVFTSLQIFDVERIEVLRGPQGTLYGKNTTGGAVNVFTRRPDLNDGLSGYVTAGYGRFDRRELSGGANIPIVEDQLAGRVAFTVTKVDGFVKNLFPGGRDQNSIDDWAVRGSLAWRPTDRFDALLRYTRSKSTPTGYGVIADDIGIVGPGGAGFGTGYTRDGLGFFENESDYTGRLRIRNESAVLTMNWDVAPGMRLTSVSAYDDGNWLTLEDGDGTPFSLLHDDYLSDARAWSQDLRLTSTGDGPLKWLVGAYYYKDRVVSSQVYRYYYAFAGDNDGNGQLDCFDDFLTGCGYENEFRQVRESVALYTQNSYDFGNGLTATLGVRYTKDDNRLDYYRASLRYLDPATGLEVLNVAPTITAPPVDRLKSENVSGKIGLSYELANGSLLYGNLSRGYRGGSFNGQALIDPSEVTIARPERLDALEVGLKTQTADRRLRVNAAAFYYDYRNQQFIDVTPLLLQILYNAPKARLWGGEVELTAAATANLTLRAGASYLNSEYEEINLRGTDLAGNKLILAPKWTLTGGFDWQLAEGDFGRVTLHGDTRYTSRLYFDAFNTPQASQPGYWIHDARLTYETPDGDVSISAWIKNAADKRYRVYRLRLEDSFNLNYGQRGRPREYGVQLTYKF